MAKDNSSTLFLLAAAGIAVYGWYQGWFANLFGAPAATAPATPATPVAPTATTSGGTVVTVPPVVQTPAVPIYTPVAAANPTANRQVSTLSSMFGALQAAEMASFGSDSAFSGTASNPVASYDVHNWYLVNRANVGVKDGELVAPDHTSQISLNDYWSWASGQLSNQGLVGWVW